MAAERAIVRLRGSDFRGGAAEVFGGTQHGMSGVNYVYAESTGSHASMRAIFQVDTVPAGEVFLFLHGRDDDAADTCPIAVTLNGKTVFVGPSGFPGDAWKWNRYALSPQVLVRGRNELVIRNTVREGPLGQPPWFMVASACVGGRNLNPAGPRPIEEDFRVDLPREVRPLPEPIAEGSGQKGFRIRGTKGWVWHPKQYLSEIPVLAKYKMNFLMNCYGSMYDIENQRWNTGKANRWWEPLPPAKKAAWEEVVRACQSNGLLFCFCMNPNLLSPRILDYNRPQDLDDLWQHYQWMQGLGVKWFCVCLDDISKGIDAAGQAKLMNALLGRLRAGDPQAELILCPTFYWGVGEDPAARAYLGILARDLHKDVYVFWTGPKVVTPRIPRAAAEAYRKCVGHRLIIWDNYPVNDSNPTLHLGPVTGRDADLCEVVDGFMANPLCPQNEINRIPLLTIADYTAHPAAYDPARSIGQAIVHLADGTEQRQVLADLVELYPGMLLVDKGTNWNSVLQRFNELLRAPHSRYMALLYLNHVQDVSSRLGRCFPDRFQDARKTVDQNLEHMRKAFQQRYAP